MVEIELKLVLSDAADVDHFLAEPLLQTLVAANQQLDTTYFDTATADLQRNHMALRIRQESRIFTQTIKKNISHNVLLQQQSALQKNIEWEAVVANLQPDFSLIMDMKLRHELDMILHDKIVSAIFMTQFLRRSWLYTSACGTIVEISLDQGFITCGERRNTICEIELELKQSDNEQVLYALAKQLSGKLKLSTDTSSKAKRGYALAQAAGIIQV